MSERPIYNANDIMGLAEYVADHAPPIPLIAFKPADTTRTGTEALAVDPDLSIALLAGKTYQIEIGLYLVIGAGGFQCDLAGGTATMTAINGQWTTFAEDMLEKSRSVSALATNPTSFAGMLLTYMITVTVNAGGTLILRWAQGASDVSSTSIQRGSYMRGVQLD